MAASNATLSEKSGAIQPLKRKANKQIASAEDRDKAKEAFADWLIEQGAKHRDKRETLDKFAERWGVSRQTLIYWKKDRGFVDTVRSRMPDYMAMRAPELYPAIAKYALAGDATMMKLALQQSRLLEAEKSESKNLHIVLDASQIPRPSIDTE